jgi:hypothetical protein
MHGGAAPQVRAAREARVLMAKAAAAYGGAVMERSPAEALLAAGQALDASLQALERLAGENGKINPLALKEIREAARESGRMAKLIQDAGLDERRTKVLERDQLAMGRAFELVLAAWGLDPSAVEVRQSVAEALERVWAGDLSPLSSRVVSAPVLALQAPVVDAGEV